MFCSKCYADLTRSDDAHCPRCGRRFEASDPATWLRRPFPPPPRVVGHTVLTLFLATIVSVGVAFVLATQQLKYLNSGH